MVDYSGRSMVLHLYFPLRNGRLESTIRSVSHRLSGEWRTDSQSNDA